MKKHLLFILALAGASLYGSAQCKISLSGMTVLEEFKRNGFIVPPTSGPQLDKGDVPFATHSVQPEQRVTTIPAFVALTEDGSAEMLAELGLKVNTDLGSVVVVELPLSRTEEIAALPWVRQLDFGTVEAPMMNFARQAGNVSSVQDGFNYNGSTMSFDGTGVVCGMMDTGLDPNHINFKNDAGDIRIQRLWWMNSTNGTSVEYTPATIPNFSTDNNAESHATHVAGIIGGSYKGESYFLSLSTPDGSTGVNHLTNPGDMPYYGVATGADLAFACGELYTPNITTGVANIISYAESVGKPAVVNLSLGHTTGPHDGTDSYSHTLSELGKRGIICMSAGNDGDEPISLVKNFTSTAAGSYVLIGVARTMNGAVAANYGSGLLDIWGESNTPLTVKVGIVGANREFTQLLANDPSNTAYASTSTSGNTDFTSKCYGSITMQTSINSLNNRFQCALTFNGVSPNGLGEGEYIGIYISGAKGQTAYIYGTANTLIPDNVSFKATIDGALKTSTGGSAANSINDGACASNIISVGASVSRTKWGRLDGAIYQYSASYEVGNIAPFSSYGATFQGTQLPLVVGPGAMILSSYSTPYLNAYPSQVSSMVGKQEEGSRTNYWGGMQGTSMSCPFVTGTIGLWLQADPTLTYDKVMDVIKNTSVTNATTEAAPKRWGHGLINGEAGMRQVLAQRAAIGDVWSDDAQRLIISGGAGSLDVFVAGETSLTVSLTDLQGRCVAKASADADRVILNTSALMPGIYIVKAEGATSTYTRKLTL